MSEQTQWGTVGDRVGLYRRGHLAAATAKIGTITKITKTQVVVDGGPYRFYRETGQCVGDRNDGPQLCRVEDPRVQDALAVAELSAMEWELDKARKNERIRSRSDVVRVVRETTRAYLALAERLGVNLVDIF